MLWIKDVLGNLVNLDECYQITVVANDTDGTGVLYLVKAWPAPAMAPAITLFAGIKSACRNFVDVLHALMIARDAGLAYDFAAFLKREEGPGCVKVLR